MKGVRQGVVSIVLHPVVLVLAWINITGRSAVGVVSNVVWGSVRISWGLGPILGLGPSLYILVGGGTLWSQMAPLRPQSAPLPV